MKKPSWYPNAAGKCAGSFTTVSVGHGMVQQDAKGKVKVSCPVCTRMVGLRCSTSRKRVIAQHMPPVYKQEGTVKMVGMAHDSFTVNFPVTRDYAAIEEKLIALGMDKERQVTGPTFALLYGGSADHTLGTITDHHFKK